MYTDVWMRSYIDETTYLNLRRLENNYRFSQKPIVLFCFRAGEYTESTLALYRNWIKATIGDHYAFFGKLLYLIGDYKMPFQDTHLNYTSTITWQELVDSGADIYNNPVLIISGDFYPSLSPQENALSDEIIPRVYMLKESFQQLSVLYSTHLVAYEDFYSSSPNWYVAKYDWASTGFVVEHSENPAKNIFFMTLCFPILREGDYVIKIHMQNSDENFAPVKVILDDIHINTIHYNGSMQPRTYILSSNHITKGLHYLTLRIDDLSQPHYIGLDYVEFTLEKQD